MNKLPLPGLWWLPQDEENSMGMPGLNAEFAGSGSLANWQALFHSDISVFLSYHHRLITWHSRCLLIPHRLNNDI